MRWVHNGKKSTQTKGTNLQASGGRVGRRTGGRGWGIGVRDTLTSIRRIGKDGQEPGDFLVLASSVSSLSSNVQGPHGHNTLTCKKCGDDGLDHAETN